MKSNLKCEVVKDLIPLYIDNLTCEVTNKEIEEHLKECSECKGVIDMMKNEVIMENSETVEKEVDYLKKIKNINKKKIWTTIGICGAIIIAVLVAVFLKVHIIGNEINKKYNYDYVMVEKLKVQNGKVEVILYAPGLKISKIKSEVKGGELKLNVMIATAISDTAADKRYKFKKEFDSNIDKIYLGKKVIYENGADISTYVNDMFNAKINTVEEEKALANLEKTVEMDSALYIIDSKEVLNDNEKFGIQYNTLEAGFDEYNKEDMELEMKISSYYMLACAKNLEYIKWNYEFQGKTFEYVVTKEVASSEMNKDIKEYGKSVKNLQELFDYLTFDEY